MKSIKYFFLLVGIIGCNLKASENDTSTLLVERSSSERLNILSDRAVKDIEVIRFDSLSIPRTISEDGTLEGTKSKSWTSGFYPGVLWQLYDYSKDESLKKAAIKWSTIVEKEKWDGGTHDLGFKIYCPFGKAYKITKNEKYKDVFITAAKTLSTRYNSKIGALRSWDHHEHLWGFPVIIDNMMNLEMLFEASKITGDSTYYKIANRHATTTLENHFRPDNSSYHVVDYDVSTGKVVKKNTHQGYNHESAWSRGQAWGLYGYTVAYRYTGEKKYLQQAQKIAEYIFMHPHLPKDKIPYWDYNAPNIPDEPRDVSAAAITASGLLELSTHDIINKNKYQKWATEILANLATEKYECTVPPFFLKHSVGSIPGSFEVDAPIIYADYYYVEALLRKRELKI
jgi:rhamnogalacturonyl hydrolase YesR